MRKRRYDISSWPAYGIARPITSIYQLFIYHFFSLFLIFCYFASKKNGPMQVVNGLCGIGLKLVYTFYSYILLPMSGINYHCLISKYRKVRKQSILNKTVVYGESRFLTKVCVLGACLHKPYVNLLFLFSII